MKTTLRKLISEINFDDKRLQSEPDWEVLAQLFNINGLYWSEDQRLKAYHIKTWYCTDSYVGIRAYFLDGKFICISNQSGRKADEDFGFTSHDDAKMLRDYLFSLVHTDDSFSVDVFDGFDVEIDSTYKIEYNTQILHKTAFLDGKKVTIIKTNYSSEGIKSPNYFHSVEIEIQKGQRRIVDCRTLDFEYNTID